MLLFLPDRRGPLLAGLACSLLAQRLEEAGPLATTVGAPEVAAASRLVAAVVGSAITGCTPSDAAAFVSRHQVVLESLLVFI